jgi:hypothetical protein
MQGPDKVHGFLEVIKHRLSKIVRVMGLLAGWYRRMLIRNYRLIEILRIIKARRGTMNKRRARATIILI